jgi:hypothetical protein
MPRNSSAAQREGREVHSWIPTTPVCLFGRGRRARPVARLETFPPLRGAAGSAFAASRSAGGPRRMHLRPLEELREDPFHCIELMPAICIVGALVDLIGEVSDTSSEVLYVLLLLRGELGTGLGRVVGRTHCENSRERGKARLRCYPNFSAGNATERLHDVTPAVPDLDRGAATQKVSPGIRRPMIAEVLSGAGRLQWVTKTISSNGTIGCRILSAQ